MLRELVVTSNENHQINLTLLGVFTSVFHYFVEKRVGTPKKDDFKKLNKNNERTTYQENNENLIKFIT